MCGDLQEVIGALREGVGVIFAMKETVRDRGHGIVLGSLNCIMKGLLNHQRGLLRTVMPPFRILER